MMPVQGKPLTAARGCGAIRTSTAGGVRCTSGGNRNRCPKLRPSSSARLPLPRRDAFAAARRARRLRGANAAAGESTGGATTEELAIYGEMSAPFVTFGEGIQARWAATAQDPQPLAVPAKFVEAAVEASGEGEREGSVGDFKLQNVFLRTRTHRKMHLELATGARGLEVLHCVLFPDVNYDLPLYAVDMVAFGGRVTLCIVDLCPAGPGPLRPAALQKISDLEERVLGSSDLKKRPTPEWGLEIFSDRCLLVAPETPAHVDSFVEYSLGLLDIYLQEAAEAVAVGSATAVKANAAGQERFCYYQLQNDKTRRILENSFGKEWADSYMTEVLFEAPKVPAGRKKVVLVASSEDETGIMKNTIDFVVLAMLVYLVGNYLRRFF